MLKQHWRETMEWTLDDYDEAARRGQADVYLDDGTAYFNAHLTDPSGFIWSAVRVEFDDGEALAGVVPFVGY